MRLYIRKVFPHDVTHEVSVTKDIVENYFEAQERMTFKGLKSGKTGIVTINNATDPRFGGEYKSILDAEGGYVVEDLIVTYKHGAANYSTEIIRVGDDRYNTYASLFNNKDRHAIIFTDNENNDLQYYAAVATKGYERNRIFFGAPGTGKTFRLNKEKDVLLGPDSENSYERVTFHPEYSYAGFVGTYKPVPKKEEGKEETISYEYVPGPFMRILVKALISAQSDRPEPFLLIIEEINRANVAAVFGDVFQLLDRDKNGASEYPIETTEDMRKYISEKIGIAESKLTKVKIPSNLFIWATMNSADQGVFPMDTAFKRRWSFEYQGIDEGEEKIADKTVNVNGEIINWNRLRKAINNTLVEDCNVNEDKLMGPFFISMRELGEEEEIDSDRFKAIFKNKVIMYLFSDAAKQRPQALFDGGINAKLYSSLCDAFDKKGVKIFKRSITEEVGVASMGDEDTL